MNIKHSIITLIFVSLLSLPFITEAKESNIFITPLQKCTQTLDAAEKVYNSIQIAVLPIKYRDGERLEKNRARLLRYIAMARKGIAHLKKYPNVYDVLQLFDIFKEINRANEALNTNMLDVYVEVMDNTDKKGSIITKWLSDLNDIQKIMDDTDMLYSDAAFKYAEKIDRRLESCK
jgi:hypothetical protein